MEDQIAHLTREGFRKFEAELNYLRTVRRSEVADRLRIALEEGEKPETFHLVGAAEADPTAGKISDASPLGRALMGKKKGEVITISAPDGAFSYKIISVQNG
jgi:transcription elongation factor GreA